jgi:DNA ligase-1
MTKITEPMLAVAVSEPKKLKFPTTGFLCTPKLDGIRAIKKDGVLTSRKFITIPNKQIQKKFAWIPEGIDGELIKLDDKCKAGVGFSEAQSIIMREEEVTKEEIDSIVYFIFDYVSGDLNKPYKDRMKELEKIASTHANQGLDVIFLLPKLMTNIADLKEYEEECVRDGFEGVMLRTADSPYKLGRSTEKEQWLLKWKRFEDSEAEILGFEEQQHNNNKAEKNNVGRTKRSSKKAGKVGAGKLGALLVRDLKSGVEFGLGSGFKDAQRKDIWANQAKYKTEIVKYKFQPAGVKEKPRFPTFLGFRDRRDM